MTRLGPTAEAIHAAFSRFACVSLVDPNSFREIKRAFVHFEGTGSFIPIGTRIHPVLILWVNAMHKEHISRNARSPAGTCFLAGSFPHLALRGVRWLRASACLWPGPEDEASVAWRAVGRLLRHFRRKRPVPYVSVVVRRRVRRTYHDISNDSIATTHNVKKTQRAPRDKRWPMFVRERRRWW